MRPGESPRRATPAPGVELGGEGGDLLAHRIHAELAQNEVERRLVALHGGDDGLGGAHRIAGLMAAVARDHVEALVNRLRIGRNARGRGLQRAPAPIGAEGAGFDHRDLDAQRADLLRQRFGQADDAEFARRVIGGTGVADQPADRGDVDDMARTARACRAAPRG
jgi:hypothetical protein